MSDNGVAALRPVVLKCTICGFLWEPFGISGFNVCTSCGCDWRYLDQLKGLPAWLKKLRELDGGKYIQLRKFGTRGW